MRRAESSTEVKPESGWVTALIDLRALRRLDQPLDLLVGEAAEGARLARDRDRDGGVVAILPDAAEVEPLVDGLLELDGAAPSLGVALGEPRQPLRSHPHVRDLVGEDVIHRALEDGIAQLPRDVH